MSEQKLGEYIYMGMGSLGGQRVCMSVAYKLDYCVKKALQFEQAIYNTFPHKETDRFFEKVNKVRVGELEAETSFSREELSEYVHKFSK